MTAAGPRRCSWFWRLAGLLLAAGAVRLIWLARLVRRLGRTDQDRRPRVAAYVRALLPLWARVFAIAILLFVVQENYERWSIGQSLPGLAVLESSALVGPVQVFLLVSLAVAAAGALFTWGIAALEALVEAGRTRHPRSEESHRPRRPTGILVRASSLLGRNLAGRAPPFCLPA